MFSKLFTSNYSAAMHRQGRYRTVWLLFVVAVLIMILIMPTQFYLWLILAFAALMAYSAHRALNNQSVPVPAARFIDLCAIFAEEDAQNSELYEENKNEANRLGVVNIYAENDEEERESSKEARSKRISRVDNYEVVDEDEKEEEWRV